MCSGSTRSRHMHSPRVQQTEQRIGILSSHIGNGTDQHSSPSLCRVEARPCLGGGTGTEGTFKVAVLGAAGGIGQPLSLLLKQSHICSKLIGELSLYDVANTAGVAADLSHINTGMKVTNHTGPESLSSALYGAHLVIIPAGVPRKPGMTRDDLFNINAGIVRTLIEGVASYCPRAWIAIISNPVNSTVPIAAEVLKKAGVLNTRTLFGVTTLDVVRANTFVGQALGIQNAASVSVPVVGGHAGKTILPILSASTPPLGSDVTMEQRKKLMERIQDAGTEVVKAKAGAGSATLSMAYAAAEFATSCLRAMAGEKGIIECSYVVSSLYTNVPFFSSPVKLGQHGIEEFVPMPRMSEMESEAFNEMIPELQKSIQKGIDFVARS